MTSAKVQSPALYVSRYTYLIIIVYSDDWPKTAVVALFDVRPDDMPEVLVGGDDGGSLVPASRILLSHNVHVLVA